MNEAKKTPVRPSRLPLLAVRDVVVFPHMVLPLSVGRPKSVKSIEAEEFLILPHPEVLTYMRNKTADYGRWLGGMRKLNRRFGG